VHRGLREACDPLLLGIPITADITAEEDPTDDVVRLLDAAVQTRFVLLPVATKVLHRKRPRLIPILDQVVMDHYLGAMGRDVLRPWTQDKKRAAEPCRVVLEAIRSDALEAAPLLREVQIELADRGYSLTTLRILDILVWTQVEQRGYYR
jgi:hypothetical protein